MGSLAVSSGDYDTVWGATPTCLAPSHPQPGYNVCIVGGTDVRSASRSLSGVCEAAWGQGTHLCTSFSSFPMFNPRPIPQGLPRVRLESDFSP